MRLKECVGRSQRNVEMEIQGRAEDEGNGEGKRGRSREVKKQKAGRRGACTRYLRIQTTTHSPPLGRSFHMYKLN